MNASSIPISSQIGPFIDHFCMVFEDVATQNKRLKCKLFETIKECLPPLKDYVCRFADYGVEPKESFPQSCLLAADLIDKSGYPVTPLTIHKLFATAIRLVTKFYHDDFYPNSYFAKLSGIPLETFNQLELLMFSPVQNTVDISGDRYQAFAKAFRGCLPRDDELQEPGTENLEQLNFAVSVWKISP